MDNSVSFYLLRINDYDNSDYNFEYLISLQFRGQKCQAYGGPRLQNDWEPGS